MNQKIESDALTESLELTTNINPLNDWLFRGFWQQYGGGYFLKTYKESGR